MDGAGLPLALVVCGANVPDVRHLGATLEALRFERWTPGLRPRLLADAGYWGLWPYYQIVEHGYEPVITGQGQDRFYHAHDPGYRSRRYVVEACHSWFNRYRKLKIRYEKTLRAYYALLCLAAADIVWKRLL